ncbi:hypothetical protein AAFF_G00113720 [Aldrovandia affinis]|uniref:Uncharacterized protein n=1 Tax=Aldrovandia affinis TaxID=143900 RepID=A0AAD7RT71_9TELE|nr:hypothetical protein AAFF_G00113720 [Aldrovandia affinis]
MTPLIFSLSDLALPPGGGLQTAARLLCIVLLDLYRGEGEERRGSGARSLGLWEAAYCGCGLPDRVTVGETLGRPAL